MTAPAAIWNFVLVGVCLVLFYLVWRLSARMAGAESQREGARRWVTLGRVFVAASLAAPLLCAAIERIPFSSRWLPETSLAGRLLEEADGPGSGAVPDRGYAGSSPIASADRLVTDIRGSLIAVWAAGAIALLGFRGLQWCRLRAFVSESVPLRRHGRVRVLVHPEPVSPFAVRLWRRALVVIPAYLVASGRWRNALRHELVHHRRGDTRWAIAWDLLTAVLWPNPAAWLWRRRLAELQELACDEQLLARGLVDPAAYGETLLDVAEALSANPRLRLGACASMAGRRSSSALSRRLDRIVGHAELGESDARRCAATTIAGLGLWAAAAAAWAAGGAGTGSSPAPDLRLRADLQEFASRQLSAHLERVDARGGVVVVMDPATGAVLARAGLRRDAATGKTVVDDEAPLAPRYPGASTMKPLVVAGALEARAVTGSDAFDTSPGTRIVDGKTYREWKDGGLGKVTPADVVVRSSNLGVIEIAVRLGSERLADFLGRLGYDVSGTATAAELSLGHSDQLRVSAHQMAYAYSVLVSGGRDPRTGGAVVRPDVSDFLRNALVRAVEDGTGTEAKCKGLAVGGKTGTSLEEVDGKRSGTAYFVGFAPAGGPRLVVSVVVDDPAGEVNGNRHAASLFREIVEGGLPMLGPAAGAGR